jgi:hypothetical protein
LGRHRRRGERHIRFLSALECSGGRTDDQGTFQAVTELPGQVIQEGQGHEQLQQNKLKPVFHTREVGFILSLLLSTWMDVPWWPLGCISEDICNHRIKI